MYSPKRRFRLFRSPAWGGGAPDPPAGSDTDILSFARALATTYEGYDAVPTDGGALTINSQAVGNYEVTARKADTTISSFTASDWFTSTKDTTSSWIIINGNLTINSGQTLIPSVRKLFTVVYVTGNLVCNGTISMTTRGANHSGTGDSGGATTAVAIRIGTGTFDAVTNPQIPAAGGAGGTGRSTAGQNAGTAGTDGGTGGGGGGYWFSSGPTSGSGSAGTCFSGGSGGGSSYVAVSPTPTSGGTNGGAGGRAGGTSGGGGAGNNGGAGIPSPTYDGGNGTGGVLIIICEGSLTGSGTIVASGVSGGSAGGVSGGGSGGGSINVLYGTNPSSAVTLTAAGGSTGVGGNGTARKLAIGAN
jgi:hypothetical protein